MAKFNWLRHYLIGFALFVAAIGLILFICNKKNKIVYTILLVLFLTMPNSNKLDRNIFHAYNTYREAATENKDMLEAIEFIKNHPDYTYFSISDREDFPFAETVEMLYKLDIPIYNTKNKKYFNDKIKNKVILNKQSLIHYINQYKYSEMLYEKYKDNVIFENDTYVFYNAD